MFMKTLVILRSIKELFSKIIIIGFENIRTVVSHVSFGGCDIETINLVGNQFPWRDMKTEMLLEITYIFLFTSYTMKERRKIEKKRERKRKQKSARKCTFFSLPRRTIIHHYLDPVLLLIARIYTQTGKYATQVSGIQWHETALRYSTFTLDRKEMGEREESEKERAMKEEGTLKAALATDLSNSGICKFFCSKRYFLILGFAVIHISFRFLSAEIYIFLLRLLDSRMLYTILF